MNTLLALLIMVAALTVGLGAIALVMLTMGLAGAPGAIMFAAGQKTKNSFLSNGGLIVAAIGQSYIVGAYAVFVVSLLRWFTEGRPDFPTWPLWIAAFFHSGAAPEYGMKERPDNPTAQHHTLGIVALLATVVFFVAAFAPNSLSPFYGWVPLYNATLQLPSKWDDRRGSSEPVNVYSFTEKHKKSVRDFFAGYQYLQSIQVLVKELPNTRNPIEDLAHIETLIDKALERLAECDTELLDGIHPGWADITTEKFIPALNKMKSGIQSDGDRSELVRADALLASFDTWLKANWDDIAQKVGE